MKFNTFEQLFLWCFVLLGVASLVSISAYAMFEYRWWQPIEVEQFGWHRGEDVNSRGTILAWLHVLFFLLGLGAFILLAFQDIDEEEALPQ